MRNGCTGDQGLNLRETQLGSITIYLHRCLSASEGAYELLTDNSRIASGTEKSSGKHPSSEHAWQWAM